MISVIVPVYNVEKYLSQCIDSILQQTFREFELILVDDGSTDNSGNICEEYLSKDARIQVIHQKNQGLSAARNHGLDVAKGEYITFVDSDDALSSYYLESLFRGIKDTGASISMCSFLRFENEQVAEQQCDMKYRTDDWREKCLLLNKSAKYCIVCAKLYCSFLFEKFRFTNGCKCNEDEDIIYKLYYEAKEIAETDDALYFYRITPNSIMNRPYTIDRWTVLDIFDKRRVFYEAIGEKELADLTDKTRNCSMAKLSLRARKDGIYAELPSKYKMSKKQALRVIHQNCPEDNFQWHLAQIYPAMLRPYLYMKKIREKLATLRTG